MKRWWHTGLALATTAAFCSTAHAQAQLSRRDQAALLWSTQLRFDSSHAPVVPIAVADGEDQIRLSSRSGFRVELDAEGATAISLPDVKELVAEVIDGQPAVLAHYAVLAKLEAQNLDALQQAQALWRARDFQTVVFELGSVFGFFGRVLDSRVYLLALDQPHSSREEAIETLSALQSAYDDVGQAVHALVKDRPTGRVRLSAGRMSIEATDLVRLRALDGGTVKAHGVRHGKGFSWEKRTDRDYQGDIVIAPDREGKTAAVNPVDAETLLRGLVPSEIYPSSPGEALKAQSVVARGELLAKIGHRHLTDPYVVCSDVHCQVYKGAGQEDPRTNAAIDATRGLMLFDTHGLVDAVYSANCGGHTEHNEHVWGGEPKPSLRGQWDQANGGTIDLSSNEGAAQHARGPGESFCAKASKGSSNARWQVVLSTQDIAKGLGPDRDVGTPTALVPLERGVSGRITRLRVDGTKGQVELQGELVIRKALGGLKSSMFVVEPSSGGSFTLRGAGFGHGVGMCQTGAIGAAESGWDHTRILQHYYRGSSVERVY